MLSIDEISSRLGTPKSTTYRYVNTLHEQGFLDKSSPGVYRPGIQFLRLGQIAHRQRDLADVALPIMQELADATGETVLLTRASGRHAVCIERVETEKSVRITFEIGQVQPLHAGASSKVLLAYLPEDTRETYLSETLSAFTEHTTTTPDTLREQLAAVRAQGCCVSHSEVDEGATSIAVPVFGKKKGRVLAGLSVAGPSFRMEETAVQKRYIELLHQAADALHRRLMNNGDPAHHVLD